MSGVRSFGEGLRWSGVAVVEVKNLPPPKDVQEIEEKAAKRVDQLIKGRLQQLSEDQLDRLQKHVKKLLKNARRESEPLRRKLVRYSELLEGIVEETNFPFEGASNVTLRAAAGLARTFESTFNPALYADPDLFAPDLDPGAQQEMGLDEVGLMHLQEGFNHSFSRKYNGLNVLKGGTIPAFRDGTFLVNGSWERVVQRVNDQRTYRSWQEFQKDYPNAEESKIEEERYRDIADFFLIEGKEAELIVKFSHNHVQFDGIEYRQLLRTKFLLYPTTALKLEKSELYGAMYDLGKEELKRRAKKGEFYKDQVEEAIKRRGSQFQDAWDKNRLYVEGFSVPEPESAPMRLGSFVVKFDLDRDGVVEQYHVTVVSDGDTPVVIACRPYELRHNTPDVIPFRLVRRDHAFDGISLVGDGEDMFNQIDTLFRHDNNVMMLTTSPIFMINDQLKETMDLGRSENVIRPGVSYWVPDINKAAKQLEVQDVAAASGDNNTKLSIISRFLEMLIGVSQGESGQSAPNDPRAPTSKTTLLLMQAGKRADRCLDEWCESIPDLAKLHATLLYQFSGQSDYKFTDKKGQQQSFPVKVLADSRLRWVSRRRSVTLTPEFALQRLQQLLQVYMSMRPLLMQGDGIAIEIWNRTVKNSGEPQAEKFLVDINQAPEMAQKAMEMAKQQFLKKAHLDAIAAGEKKLAQATSAELAKTLGEADRMKLSGLQDQMQSEALEQAQAQGQAPQGNQVPTAA
jgi:hypothetical protein